MLLLGEKTWQIYNDGYRPIFGDKHSQSMGGRGADVWPEIWHIGPMAHSILEGSPAVWNEHLLLPIVGKRFLEEASFTFSYSPVPGETDVGGVLVFLIAIGTPAKNARAATGWDYRSARELSTRVAEVWARKAMGSAAVCFIFSCRCQPRSIHNFKHRVR